jgi:Tol biopolymer transport system component
MLATALLTAILGAALWYVWFTRTASLPPQRVLALTSYRGVEAWPSLSPDGQQVAFSWDGEKGDSEDIYVAMVGSDQPLQLTQHSARDVSPAWKPDATLIAFARLEGGRAGIFVISPLGGAERKLAEFSALTRESVGGPVETRDPGLSWSPNGRWLAVTRVQSGDDKGVFLVSASDGAVRRIVAPSKPRDEYSIASFSPKDDAMALVNRAVIEVAPLTGSDPPSIASPPRALTSYLGFVAGVAWAADGKDLIYGRARYPAPDPPSLWRIPTSGARAAERIDLAGVAAYPTISAAGHRLAFVRRSLNQDLLQLQDGHPPETLVSSTYNEQDPDFSPDGSKVAFASDRSGEGHEIWVAETADPSRRHSVTQGAHKPEGAPRWSPDGRRLVFDGVGDDGVRHVYLIDEAGGPIQTVSSKPGAFDQIPSWSRDGKWIYFGSNRTGREETWRVPAAGGEAQQMTTGGGRAPFESWDGRTLYFLRPVGDALTIFARPVAGGPERSLDIQVSFWNYAPGEQGLYYAARQQGLRPPYTFEIRVFDPASGQSRVLDRVQLATLSPGLAVRPGGKVVVIAGAADVPQDLMRIENFR